MPNSGSQDIPICCFSTKIHVENMLRSICIPRYSAFLNGQEYEPSNSKKTAKQKSNMITVK